MGVEQLFERAHRIGELRPNLLTRGVLEDFGGLCECIFAPLPEPPSRPLFPKLRKERGDLRDSAARLTDLCARFLFARRPDGKLPKLPALEDTTPLRPRCVDRTVGAAKSGARLLKRRRPVLPLQLQAQRGELLRGIALLQPHEIEHRSVATDPTRRAKPRLGGRQRAVSGSDCEHWEHQAEYHGEGSRRKATYAASQDPASV